MAHQYKVGDKVRIKKREGSSNDYPFSFTTNMAKLAEKVFVIKQIINCSISLGFKYYNGDDHKYYLKTDDICNYCWHSSMFEPVLEDPGSQTSLSFKEGDLIPICGMVGKILDYTGDGDYYLDFNDIENQPDHCACCNKLRELVPDFEKIASKFCAVQINPGYFAFPLFSTIDALIKFVQVVNNVYDSKKLITTSKTLNENEIRFQKPKTSCIRGTVPTGRAICGRRHKTAIEFGHLSNTTCYC